MPSVRASAACLLGTALALLLPATGAHAAPGDPPITPVAPVEAATVTGAAAGIDVTYACPDYRRRASDTTLSGADEYRVVFAASPAVDADGALLSANRLDRDRASASPADRQVCTSRLEGRSDLSSIAPPPSLTPGRVFWQAQRSCFSCATDEYGPVSSFVVRSPVTAALTVQPVAWRAHAFAYTASLTVPISLLDLQLQRRTPAGAWIPADPRPARMSTGTHTSAITLPPGRHALRLVAPFGDTLLVSPTRTVTVKALPRAWGAPRSVGSYTAASGSLKFRVTNGGRVVRGFVGTVSGVCPGATGLLMVQPLFLAVDPVKVAPDGRFAARQETKYGAVELRGRIVGRRVVGGYASTSVLRCFGSDSFTATRTGA